MTDARKMRKTGTSEPLTLEDCFLFAISSPADLARRLGISLTALDEHASNKSPYKHWTLAGGRKIQEPKGPLQKIHGRVHKLLARVQPPPYLHSGVRKHSYITNARQHVSAAPAIKLDIRKFFPSVTRHHVFQFFYHRMRCARDVSGILATLLTCDGRLATGSRASPILAYYCFSEMFEELALLAACRGLVLTCYVDDIAITGEGALRQEVLAEARRIIAAYGLQSHKVRKFHRRQPRVITGVAVTYKGIRLPYRRHLKISQGFEQLTAAKSDDEKITVLNSLVSRLHEAAQIEPDKYAAKARWLDRERTSFKNRVSSSKKKSALPPSPGAVIIAFPEPKFS
jgi:RNA-directed DNA polymerase